MADQPTKTVDTMGDLEMALLAVQARASIARLREFIQYSAEDEIAFDRVHALLAGSIPPGLE